MIERVGHIGQPHTGARAGHPLGQHPGRRGDPLPRTCPTPPASSPPDPIGAATGSAAGACSTTTCALVPLTPNDDTPARRGRPTAGHSIACAAMVNRDAPSHWRAESAGSKFRCSGMCPCSHAQHRLDETGDTGRRLQMTQVGLDRTQHQRRRTVALTEHLAQRVQLDRITQRRAGAVRLDVVDIGGRQPRRRQRLTHHRLLRRPVGHRLPAAGDRPG